MPKDTFMWMCHDCRVGDSGYTSQRDCERDQIAHAKRKHGRQRCYTVTDDRGRVIYRVP